MELVHSQLTINATTVANCKIITSAFFLKHSWSPLMYAIDSSRERLPMIKLLLEAGANVNYAKVRYLACISYAIM